MLKSQTLFMILLTVISLVALSLSLVCIMKKEKYDVLVANDGTNVGLKSLDLATNTDITKQIKDVTTQINTLRDEITKNYISWGDKVHLYTEVSGIGKSGCSTYLSTDDDNCNLLTAPSPWPTDWTLENPYA